MTMDLGKEISSYFNGNYKVTIYESGTKVREIPSGPTLCGREKSLIFKPIYPETIDLKITDYCNAGCAFCHENSTTKGIHTDYKSLMKLIEGIPYGTELAIGGGNPMDYPQLEEFLKYCKELDIICNITVNLLHLKKNINKLIQFQEKDLIKGIGISRVNFHYLDAYNWEQNPELNKLKNVVDHYILGILDFKRLGYSLENVVSKRNISINKRVLFLGYKDFGRGISYKEERKDSYSNIEQKLKETNKLLPRVINNLLKVGYTICFDNLAIEQLDLKNKLPKEMFDKFYMGDDGQFSMYIDAVKMEYALTSRSEKRHSYTNEDLKNPIFLGDIFQNIQNEVTN